MNGFHHETVLADEAAALLAPGPGKVVLDGTLGGGGHAERLLEAGAKVIGVDKDPRALAAASERLVRFGAAFTAVKGDFRDSRRLLDEAGVAAVDGALVDLGVSSPQLDLAERGMSFSRPGPLDMRMSDSGESLRELLARTDERALGDIIEEWGEERFARPIARAVKRAFEAGEVNDTAQLASVVAGAIPRKAWPRGIHPATRTFQALRIAVNDELGALDAWLAGLPEIVRVGGRAAAISFHSLEDRRVKHRFQELTRGCICPPDLPICACGAKAAWRVLSKKAVTASDAEVERNPRARSARLRGVERIA